MFLFSLSNTVTLLLHTILLIASFSISHAQTGHGVVGAAYRGHASVVMTRTLGAALEDLTTAAAQLLVELLLEAFAQQIQGEGVEAGVGEGEDSGDHAAHEVSQGDVDLKDERKTAGDNKQ